MNALLICPGERPEISQLTTATPVATVPILGKNLVQYWLEHLASLGATSVRILAVDRPELVRATVGDGAQWGLKIEVIPAQHELSIAEARAQHHTDDETKWIHAPNDAVLIDHLPGLSHHSMCDGYDKWFKAVIEWMPLAAGSARIGLRQIQPGIWAGLHARVSSKAKLIAPCWLGDNVSVGPNAQVGPGAVLENKVFVEAGSEISHSIVGAETFVGECTELKNSIAAGNLLINWKNASSVRVADDFLLCSLAQKELNLQPTHWIGRLAAAGLILCTSPIGLIAFAVSKLTAQQLFRACEAVEPRVTEAEVKKIRYYELSCSNRWLKRWPQLWNIADGSFTWVGNRPLTTQEAADLSNDFERLWLSAPIGFVSLADVEGCEDGLSEEARAHASFYAVQATHKLNLNILQRAALSSLKRRPTKTSLIDDRSIWKGIPYENPTARKHAAYQRT